jgi:hypothetical protein
MSYRDAISHDQLTDALYYNEQFGVFVWRKPRQGVKPRLVAGTLNARGYINLCIGGVSYLAHRLAWFYVNGEWPENDIDHLNHKRSDNRIENLRVVTQAENSRNMLQRGANPLGVYWSKEKLLWEARIRDGGKNHFLGRFENKEEAITARKAAEVQRGYHKNHSGE